MNHKDNDESIQKLGKLIKGIRTAMLTTVESDGTLRSRPMATQDVEFDGTLWFFTAASSPKVRETRHNNNVSVTYQNGSDQVYVSVSGTAELVFDEAKKREFWTPLYKAWFPKGVDDPEVALLKVTVEKAEYWDAPSSSIVYLFGMAKALVTGKPLTEIGDHAKVELDTHKV